MNLRACRPFSVGLASLACAAFVSACVGHAGTPPSPSPHLQLTEVRSTTRGTDVEGAFCADFDLDSSAAADFFASANVIDAADMHDHYDYLPCYVRGTAKDKASDVVWEIRAGGTATVQAPNGAIIFLGCRKCADDFR